MPKTPESPHPAPMLRAATTRDLEPMYALINAAAQAYRGVIPADCWHEPYMPREDLHTEISAGVRFLCAWHESALLGVMGMQTVADVDLIRHAYVAPPAQRLGVGRRLLEVLLEAAPGTVLVGTWAAATWAIRFYQRAGFTQTPRAETIRLLQRYWTVSTRQIETSVVLRRGPA